MQYTYIYMNVIARDAKNTITFFIIASISYQARVYYQLDK